MNKVSLTRLPSGDQGTFGRLSFGNQSVHTVELPWNENRQQKSCIPIGAYLCQLISSPKFGLVYGLCNVPGRSHILIHSANVGGNVDLGWQSQLHGCIAPAERLGLMRISDGRMQQAGLVSRAALRRLMAWADQKPFVLEIK